METKKIIILIVIILLGLFVWGYSTNSGTPASVQGIQTNNNQETLLTAEEILYDFGSISMKDGNVSKDFIVKNNTEVDIFVSKVVTSCMCTNAYIVKPDGSVKGPFGMVGHGAGYPADENIKPGESRIIRVVYDPNAHGPAGVGPIDRFISLTDDSDNELQLEIKAVVRP